MPFMAMRHYDTLPLAPSIPCLVVEAGFTEATSRWTADSLKLDLAVNPIEGTASPPDYWTRSRAKGCLPQDTSPRSEPGVKRSQTLECASETLLNIIADFKSKVVHAPINKFHVTIFIPLWM